MSVFREDTLVDMLTSFPSALHTDSSLSYEKYYRNNKPMWHYIYITKVDLSFWRMWEWKYPLTLQIHYEECKHFKYSITNLMHVKTPVFKEYALKLAYIQWVLLFIFTSWLHRQMEPSMKTASYELWRKEMLYLTTHSTHFIYGYMALVHTN